MTPNEKAAQLIKSKDLKDKYVAKKIGITTTTVRNICSGNSKVTIDMLIFLHSEFPGLNLNWIVADAGPKWLNKAEPPSSQHLDRLETLEDRVAFLEEEIRKASILAEGIDQSAKTLKDFIKNEIKQLL